MSFFPLEPNFAINKTVAVGIVVGGGDVVLLPSLFYKLDDNVQHGHKCWIVRTRLYMQLVLFGFDESDCAVPDNVILIIRDW